MHSELPVCERCCFCLPLRYGLITWGYIRLIIAILLTAGATLTFYGMLGMALNYPLVEYTVYSVVLGFVVLLALNDVILNTIFIIGGHKKNVKMLRAYYIYSLILWTTTTLLGIASCIYTMTLIKLGEIDISLHIWIVLMDVSSLLAQILIQAYVILLVRSEMIKLRSKCQFRFVNNAAESECTMRYNAEIANRDANGFTENDTNAKDACEFIGYVSKNNEPY
ncbi:uncharacterized protein LOC113503814 [Trichoplusia ni]|uniref:Uncharacterized protein LOC113503814 n=1 Tax=Trichoplusia ni TaxID=7111 RepID=A0A7E5WM05_TRINI|nr:uncharacterized protein LOC113503814 [Trichoplusia ni]